MPDDADKSEKSGEISQSETDALLQKEGAGSPEQQAEQPEAATETAETGQPEGAEQVAGPGEAGGPEEPGAAESPEKGASEGPPGESEIDALLAQAAQKAPSEPPPEHAGTQAEQFSFENVQAETATADKPDMDMLKDVGLNVRVELGRRKMFIEDILRLTRGSVVELDKLAGDPLDILVNDKLVAQGEVLVLNDNFCIRITRILAADDSRE